MIVLKTPNKRIALLKLSAMIDSGKATTMRYNRYSKTYIVYELGRRN